MAIKDITAEDARALLEGSPGDYTYIDVRSVPEYEAGHPKGARNVPFLHLDEATRKMEPNPDFLKVVEANFPKDANLILGCQAGGRSRRAADELAAAGYRSLQNMSGGYGGARDADGRTVASGWKELGYAVETEAGRDAAYEVLSKKAD